jgi:large conductance mechanosensitive channel
MLKEFREFALKGNVLDMAVGIIIGVAFGGIITSLVNDVLMPPIGLLLGGADFSSLVWDITGTGEATINYGVFINTVLNFIIVAFAMFLLVRSFSRLQTKREEAPAEPTTKACPFCRSEIAIGATRCPHCTSKLEAG